MRPKPGPIYNVDNLNKNNVITVTAWTCEDLLSLL